MTTFVGSDEANDSIFTVETQVQMESSYKNEHMDVGNILNLFGYLPVPVNSADSTEFTGTFTIPYLDNESTNQTRSLLNLLFGVSR